jgi:hypothetical protein
MVAICLVALALPLASVILSVQTFTRKDSAASENSEVSEALRSMLETIADKRLGSQDLRSVEARVELLTHELAGERTRIEGLLVSYQGLAIPRLESEGEIRLLVHVPAKKVKEFLDACCEEKERGAVGDPSGGLFEIVIKKIGSP